jgi:hypothetical protein
MKDREKPIINACLADAHEMLTSCWGEIARVRDTQDKIVTLSMSFKIDDSGDQPVIKSKLGFSRRFRATRETTVDPDQSVMPFIDGISMGLKANL